MRAVSLFENNRIDAGLLPNNKGAPEKSGRKISEQVQGEEKS
jgi:hypothetical protein